MLPRFEIVRRLRPVDLVEPGADRIEGDRAGVHDLRAVAPYVAVSCTLDESASVALLIDGRRLAAVYDGQDVSLHVDGVAHRSRRHGRAESPTALALSLTGPHLTAWVSENDTWTARARRDLRDDLQVHDEAALATLQVETPDRPWTAGRFGQLGLRDTRLVTSADGSPWREDDAYWFTATSAGPGFFDSAHTSVWSLDATSLEISHRADLFFHRPDRAGVFGDHATHVVRDGDRWLVATSTWGDFNQPKTYTERRRPSSLRVTLASTDADVLRGVHVLDTEEMPLPTEGLTSIATWDPHLLRRGEEWLVGFVSAPRFFSFHPALAGGPALDDLSLRAADPTRVATEGTTLLDVDGELLVLGSDGRQGRRSQRAAFPVFDTDLAQRGSLDAPYPSNLPWPTLLRHGDEWLMLAFNGRPHGGRLLGYGTHGDLVVMRSG